MLSRAAAVGLVFASLLASIAGAQVIPPAPPKPEPTPAWEPPKPPPQTPEPPKPPPLPPIAAPDLIQRDGQGQLAQLTEPLEVTAVRMLGAPEGKDDLVKAVMAERRVLYQRHLAQKGFTALKVRQAMKDILADPGHERSMDLLAPARELVLLPSLPRMLELAGAWDARYVEATDKAVKAYSAEIGKELKAKIEGESVSVQMQRAANANIRRMELEPMRELNALLEMAAARWDEIGGGAELHPTDRAAFDSAIAAMRAAATPAAKADAMATALYLLPANECNGMLERAAPPPPSPRVIPDAPPVKPGAGRPSQPMQPIKLPQPK